MPAEEPPGGLGVGDRRETFEAELRRLLREAAPGGLFAERTREIAVDVWSV